MDVALTEGQELLRRTAREFLAQECPRTLVRAMEQDDTDYELANVLEAETQPRQGGASGLLNKLQSRPATDPYGQPLERPQRRPTQYARPSRTTRSSARRG